MKFITLCVMITVAIAAFASASPWKTVSEYGYAIGFTAGCSESLDYHDALSGNLLQELAASAADSETKDRRLAASDRAQWIKAFIDGYSKAFDVVDCQPD